MEQWWQILNDPSKQHAVLVHFPIAISVLGVLLAIACVVRAGRSATLRWVLVSCYGLGSLLAFLAKEAGEDAHGKLDVVGMTTEATHLFEEHAELGSNVWLALLGCAILALLSRFNYKALRLTLVWLTLVATLATAGMVADVADYGGRMVYDQGVGVPTSPNNVNADTVGHDHSTHEHTH